MQDSFTKGYMKMASQTLSIMGDQNEPDTKEAIKLSKAGPVSKEQSLVEPLLSMNHRDLCLISFTPNPVT